MSQTSQRGLWHESDRASEQLKARLPQERKKMINRQNIDFCDEFYVVEKSVEVVVKISGEPQTIRIEALQSPSQEKYCTRAYIQYYATVQPTYPQTGDKFDSEPKDISVFVDYDLPWTDRETADEAINQALGFLREKCNS
jgi:hypothetical protein